MAKRQTRRSVSISGATYSKFKEHCDQNKISMSKMFETLLAAHLGQQVRTDKDDSTTVTP